MAAMLLLVLLSFALAAPLVAAAANATSTSSTYIVFVDAYDHPAPLTPLQWHTSFLRSLSVDPAAHLLYSYSVAAHGFAVANLPDSHLRALGSTPGVLAVVEDTEYVLHTTRSPSFLGLPSLPITPTGGAGHAAAQNIVVGVLDTGVWPESPSFSPAGEDVPLPQHWKGECEAGVDFLPSSCNGKLVGARSFSRGYRSRFALNGEAPQPGRLNREYASARDRDGHGTHTASTAAGALVANASLLGYAAGTARGMAVGARVAVYKVCWETGCLASDILAGIEAAVSDGVDVLSLSLGGGNAPYYHDTIAIGAFGASAAGVFVSCSAGNAGPAAASVANSAPWVTTVGAGTLDRDFPAYAYLGNGVRLVGVSLYSGPGIAGERRIVYGHDNASRLCLSGTLDSAAVSGQIVLCDRGVSARVEKGEVVKAAGGAGMVLVNTAASGEELVADSHLLPALALGNKAGDVIRSYVMRSPNPTARLSFGGTVLGVRPSPVVAAFSSRGPNAVVPQILKPDVIGPGVNILAGWSGVAGPTGLSKDDRRTAFNIVSGTSMSCPHISGVAALLKAAHPDWSPAAIKSALMTTAYNVDNTDSPLQDAAGGFPATPFAYGAGHVDPQKALSPGLVYDIATGDYIAFLCSLNYSIPHIQVITKRYNASCSRRLSDPGNLNYPSFSVVFRNSKTRIVRYRRVLTNVGEASSVYNVRTIAPDNVSVTVKPARLVYTKAGQKLSYTATFVSKSPAVSASSACFGWITWASEQHAVRSPVAYTWKT